MVSAGKAYQADGQSLMWYMRTELMEALWGVTMIRVVGFALLPVWFGVVFVLAGHLGRDYPPPQWFMKCLNSVESVLSTGD